MVISNQNARTIYRKGLDPCITVLLKGSAFLGSNFLLISDVERQLGVNS